MPNLNFVVKNEHWFPEIEPNLFGDEPIQYISPSVDMWDILVQAGFFSSKSQARKNWSGPGRGGPRWILPGFNLWTVGKRREILAVWNPVPRMTEE